MSAGVGFTHIDETFNTEYLGSNYQLSVDNSVYPAFRFGYQSSEKIAWELGLRLDYYSGDMDRAESDGSSNPKGYTLFFGPVYTGQAYRCKYLGPLRPMVQLNLAYTLVHNDLAYPVTQFEPAVGGNIAIGVQRKSMDLRFGYRYFKLDRDNTLSGVDASSTSSELELSGFFMELSYRFWPWH